MGPLLTVYIWRSVVSISLRFRDCRPPPPEVMCAPRNDIEAVTSPHPYLVSATVREIERNAYLILIVISIADLLEVFVLPFPVIHHPFVMFFVPEAMIAPRDKDLTHTDIGPCLHSKVECIVFRFISIRDVGSTHYGEDECQAPDHSQSNHPASPPEAIGPGIVPEEQI